MPVYSSSSWRRSSTRPAGSTASHRCSSSPLAWWWGIASLLVLALGVVVGIALLYLGVTQKRDAEGADGGDDADMW